MKTCILALISRPGCQRVAAAQQFPTINDKNVIGRIGTGTDRARRRPSCLVTLLAAMLSGAQIGQYWSYAGPASVPAALAIPWPFARWSGLIFPRPGASSLGGVH